MKKLISAIALFTVSLAPAFGSIINGSVLNFSGSFQGTPDTLTFPCSQLGDTRCAAPHAGSGDVAITGSTGNFAQYNNSFGLIKNLSNASQPLNQPFSLLNFLTFDLNANETITLTFIPLGTDPASTNCVALAHCTPQSALLVTPADPAGLSEFNLDAQALAATTSIIFSVQGVLNDVSSGQTAAVNGSFTTQLIGDPQQALEALFSDALITFSASLTASSATPPTNPAPEPDAIALMGIGVAGLLLARRKSRKS